MSASFFVIPAKAGSHERRAVRVLADLCSWIPAFAGMTVTVGGWQ